MAPDPEGIAAEKLANLGLRSEKERKRFHARQPRKAGDLVARVMAKRGYAASKAADHLERAWREAADRVLTDPKIAEQTTASGLTRGRLEVLVANHVVMQEVNFFRPQLLKETQLAMPEAKITAIRFKVTRF